MKRENNHRKNHPHLGKKLNWQKHKCRTEKSKTKKYPNDIEIPISIIVKYVSI
jgi:hypothetical protein